MNTLNLLKEVYNMSHIIGDIRYKSAQIAEEVKFEQFDAMADDLEMELVRLSNYLYNQHIEELKQKLEETLEI